MRLVLAGLILLIMERVVFAENLALRLGITTVERQQVVEIS